jgi:hypothetical protein
MMPDEDSLRRELFRDPAGKVTWAMVTFDSYTVVPLDPKFLTMYTELHFTIERVVRQQKSILLNPSDKVDADLPGGSVKTPAGESRSFDLSPQVHSVQPGHEYLVTLEYDNQGSFYRLGNFWEMENGTITSSSVGTSKLVGHTVDDAASQIRAINSEP